MSISFKKYVDITSGVGGAPQAAQRELIGRLFTDNPLVPTGGILEADDLISVGAYFGTASEEYKRAVFYFGWVSKLTTSPKKISYAFWAEADTAPLIFGEAEDFLLPTFTAISDGSFTLTLGADVEVVSALDFTTDVSLADVAATIETGIQAANVAAMWTGATVVYNAVDKRFDLVGGAVGNAVVTVALGAVGTEIAELIGWLNAGTILSDGIVAQTISDVLGESADKSNNFGSYLFIPAITIDEAVESAEWNVAQNVMFQFYLSVLEVDAQTYYDALKDIGGVGVMIQSPTAVDEYPEMMPMVILAATDYTRRNANQNYMYQQFNITETVTDTPTSNSLDALRMNYYGETQQAGSSLRFFQRGLLMGLAADPKDMNTYANEQWFKDANAVSIMNLLLALPAVPANSTGEAMVLSVIQPNIEQAQFNAVISVGKTLNPTQKAYILTVTGDENAYRQIQDIGYWITAEASEDPSNPGEFIITYLLLYSKADVVRKVEGTHTLI